MTELPLPYRQDSNEESVENIDAPPHPRRLGWIGTTALAMGGSNQCLFLITALLVGQDGIPGQGSAAILLLGLGLLLSYAAAPGWTELVLMSPNRVGGISAACTAAFRPYSPILSTLSGVCYWWGWVPTCGVAAIISATAINQWCLPGVPVSLIACSIVLIFTAINLCGVWWVAAFAVPCAVVSALLAFVSMMAPVLSGQVDWHRAADLHLTTPFPGWFGNLTSLMAGLYLIGFGAPAFEAAACHVGETRDPSRNVPRAMLASGALAAVFFIGLPVVWLGTIGPEGLGQDLTEALGPTFAPLAGSFAKSAAIGFMTFNMFHGTLQPLAGASRTLSQLAEDGLAPRILALRLSTDVPWVATLLTASFAILFLLIGDPIWLIAAANFTYLIGICLPSVAVWLLRRDAPQAVRPYRAPRGTIVLGLAAAGIWGCSALLGFEQFGLTTILIGLLMALSGAGIYTWRKIEDRRRRGLSGLGRTLHIKLTGTILLVLALDTAGYMLAIDAIPNSGNHAFITILEDIFVAVAFLTISVGIVIPGMIAHSADQVSEAARRLALGTVREFANAMDALGQGRLEAAHATVDLIPIVVNSRDELGMMAQSFNLLQDGIKHAALGLKNAREGLHGARKDLLDANAALASTVDEQERMAGELLRSKEAAVHEASHDPLTGLPNRTLFISRLEAALAMEGAGGSHPSAVLFIDLDRFKVVNDSLGHRAGDELIVQVADRLRALFRCDKHLLKRGISTYDRAMLARLGGDEFVVLLANLSDSGEAQAVADRIQKALAPPFVIENQDVYTSASIGIALSSIGHVTSADILRDADLAMYRAKTLGKARAETYDASMLALATSRMMLENDLRRALRNKEFVLHYQPIVRLATGETVGFEALVRWQPPNRDLVYPGEFIAVAEETGLILPLGLWVLGEACIQAGIWQKLALKNPLYISVNISPRQFAQDDLVQQLQKVLSDTGMDPGLVKLEITESGTMGNPERAVQILSQLKSVGVDLTIDDFGTGYSSLSYLQRFPLDVLKIDRSFVSGLINNTESRQIIKTIMALASGMGMDVVAEGIENVEQAIEMRRLGCRFGQGYWFSKPLTASDATALINNPFTKPVPRLVVA
jgi:diguanylate cyclase (GGDEF)-like protein